MTAGSKHRRGLRGPVHGIPAPQTVNTQSSGGERPSSRAQETLHSPRPPEGMRTGRSGACHACSRFQSSLNPTAWWVYMCVVRARGHKAWRERSGGVSVAMSETQQLWKCQARF